MQVGGGHIPVTRRRQGRRSGSGGVHRPAEPLTTGGRASGLGIRPTSGLSSQSNRPNNRAIEVLWSTGSGSTQDCWPDCRLEADISSNTRRSGLQAGERGGAQGTSSQCWVRGLHWSTFDTAVLRRGSCGGRAVGNCGRWE